MTQERMRDAAFPGGLDGWGRAVAGYYGGPNAYNVWANGDWLRFKGLRKLPIWVGGNDGTAEGRQAVAELRALGVPKGAYTASDMETRVDRTYLDAFGAVLHAAGYKVWVYGSASTVFGNPKLDGYWVADYAGRGAFNYAGARVTQYASGPAYDSSAVRWWTYTFGTWWR
jgi:glycoside hydrolase-like protein